MAGLNETLGFMSSGSARASGCEGSSLDRLPRAAIGIDLAEAHAPGSLQPPAYSKLDLL
ncbi:MAG: hypothetical protein HY901_26830 [Deltaproteobacteria bacterium]|nr:hypothetical protein [Deltaproteobacteria bacterium]